MTSQIQVRQPFGVLGESRLQALTSIKNRQSSISSPNASLKSFQSLKSPASAPTKKRLASDLLLDEYDSENIDPSLTLSPSKRSKQSLDTPLKAPVFVLKDVCQTAPSKLKLAETIATAGSLSSSITPTPSTDLRGSLPQNRRVSLLSSSRRIKTPFRRVDPLNKPSPLPFSIDAALSGTISSYTTPPASSLPARSESLPAPVLSKKSTKAMSSSWFFDIHEDTPEQEATNMMEHSASTLDISSDDDATTSRVKDAEERGKENVPPPDWVGPARPSRAVSRAVHRGIKCPKRAAKYCAKLATDSMAEDRVALRDLDATIFWVDDEQSGVEDIPEAARDQSATSVALTDSVKVQ